jgi:SAM-dependent methyltransferase
VANTWESPIYRYRDRKGEDIWIDVTTSVSPGLPPKKVLRETMIPFFEERGVESVLDFGAGALRHTFPLLEAGFQVCAVEFEEAFRRPACAEALKEAEKYPNFSALVWPHQFIGDRRKFDAAMLNYVLQVMPEPRERDLVLRTIYRKLRRSAYVLYMSRWNQIGDAAKRNRISDGYYMWPSRHYHSFYREFTTEATHRMMEEARLTRIRSLSKRGTDQVFVYAKGKATWI